MRHFTFSVLSLLAIATLLSGCSGDLVLLNAKGPVAAGQSGLMLLAIFLMLLVVIPSILMALYFAWKYRSSNKDAEYKPNWAHSTTIEVVVWGIPLIIIGILAWITFVGSHKYDPYKPLLSDKEPIKIQVIAEQFKWIFIYPEQNIATVNEVRFPVDTPVDFSVTSNFTMNSFFIPQLAGQIYAMAGMRTKLHMAADEIGVFRGLSANYSGYGFSQMHFKAHSTTEQDFNQWVSDIKAGNGNQIVTADKNTKAVQEGLLDSAAFAALRDGNRSVHQSHDPKDHYPTKPYPVTYFSSVENGLFQQVINQYMVNHHNIAKESSNHSSQAPEQHAPAHVEN